MADLRELAPEAVRDRLGDARLEEGREGRRAIGIDVVAEQDAPDLLARRVDRDAALGERCGVGRLEIRDAEGAIALRAEEQRERIDLPARRSL